jgi:hypothetical protein
MKAEFMQKFVQFRTILDFPINLTGTNEKSGHAPNSWHYKGEAVDFNTTAPKEWVLHCAYRTGFKGVGYYSKGYWHLDNRITDTYWVGINSSSGITYVYSHEGTYKDVFLKYLV